MAPSKQSAEGEGERRDDRDDEREADESDVDERKEAENGVCEGGGDSASSSSRGAALASGSPLSADGSSPSCSDW